MLAVVLRADDRHVGNISLQSIHPIDRAAEFAILIGDRACWGKGYGLEAGRLLFDHGFGALNLHRIACGTFDDNAAMCRLAVALGMKEEGRRREASFKRGRYVDVIEYGVLQGEYLERFRSGAGSTAASNGSPRIEETFQKNRYRENRRGAEAALVAFVRRLSHAAFRTRPEESVDAG